MYLKERMAAGHYLIGAGIFSNSPGLIEYATEGMDWIWWEAQHTHPDWQMTANGVRAANIIGVPVLVRTWTHDPGTIERLLDTGAEGIIVPFVDTPEQAAKIVSHCYYPPVGCRSFGSLRMERLEKSLDEWNRRIVTIMMIETPEGVENAEAIGAVPGVDGLLVGARDLALRRGDVADEYTAHAKIKDDLAHVVAACGKAGKAAGTVALTLDALAERVGEGYRLILAGFDVDHVEADYRHMREALATIVADADVPR